MKKTRLCAKLVVCLQELIDSFYMINVSPYILHLVISYLRNLIDSGTFRALYIHSREWKYVFVRIIWLRWTTCVKHSGTEPKELKDSGTKQLVTASKAIQLILKACSELLTLTVIPQHLLETCWWVRSFQWINSTRRQIFKYYRPSTPWQKIMEEMSQISC